MARTLTAITVALIVFGALLLNSRWFSLLAGISIILLIYEWVNLCRASLTARVVFALLLPIAIAVCWYWPGIATAAYQPVTIASGVVWFGIVLLLLTSPFTTGKSLWGAYGPELGMVVLFAFWITLVHLQREHLWLLYTLIASVAMFDTFAFLGGSIFGKHKILPLVSPSKTWEGVATGTIAALVPIAVMGYADFIGQITIADWYIFAALGSLTFAPFGDLFASLLKRLQGVKDTGSLLPGHGGVLDRVDSHLAVVPVCAFFSILLS